MSLLHRQSKGSARGRAQVGGYHDGVTSHQLQGGIDQSKALQTTCQMRVVPDDGQPEFASAMSVWGTDADHLQASRWTYVTYDPDKPEHCHLDKDRVGKEFGPLYDGKHRVMVPKETGDAWYQSLAPAGADPAPSAPSPSPEPDGLVAGLAQLADLHTAGTLSDAEFAEAKSRLLGHDGT